MATSGKLIKSIDCIETPSGFVLHWELAEGLSDPKVTVYGINDAREFQIEQPLITTGRCLIEPKNYALATAFRIAVRDGDGCYQASDPVAPQRMKKAERILIKDIRRRVNTMMRTTPIGSYPCAVLLKRIDGPACEVCGHKVCNGIGGTAVSDNCPVCLGTGISDPYYAYPRMELMHGLSPVDDNTMSQASEVQRSHKTRVFQSVFDLCVREGDVIVTGTEAYWIQQQKVSASVGNVPAVYQLTCVKFDPEDLRYRTFMELAGGVLRCQR